MDELIAPAICLSLTLVALGLIWYANESRKLAQSMRIASLDYAIGPDMQNDPASLLTQRADAYHRWLADERIQSVVVPIRNRDDEDAHDFPLNAHEAS